MKMQFILTVLLIICCQSVYSLGNNVTNTSLLHSRIDKTYTILNLNQVEISSNSSIELKDNNSTTNSDVNTSTTSYYSNNFFKNIMSGNYFDSYTLILVFAFLIGLIIISLFICCAICICKSLNRGKKRTKITRTKITNPAYDKPDIEFNLIDPPDDMNTAEVKHLIDHKVEQTTPGVDQNLNNSSISNSTSSFSTSSNNSVIQKPTTSNLNETDLTVKKEISIDESKQVAEYQTPTKSDNTDQLDKKVELFYKRFTPISDTKSQQQLIQEKKLTDSKLSVYKRASSQINDLNETKRISVASSRASIQQEINFKLIQDDIDYLVSNENRSEQGSESSKCSSDNISMKRTESCSAIYMREMFTKTDPKKRAFQNNDSLSSISVKSNFDKKSRRSMNIPFNPNAPDDVTNLNKDNSVSGFTIASEKSCY